MILRSLSLISLVLLLSCGRSNYVVLTIANPHQEDREAASILLTRGEISSWIELQEGMLPLLTDEQERPLPCQVDDVNGDGSWDELYALMDMKGKGQVKAWLKLIPAEEFPDFPTRTNLRLGALDQEGHPELEEAMRLEGVSYHNYSGVTGARYQMEGPAWENDRVGFRNYLDQRNGMDIFGKSTADLVLDGVGLPGAPSYHEPAPWGMDVLKVGTSLGAGGIAYMLNDSLYRVGDSGQGSYRMVFEGSQRSRFALEYSNWMVEGEAVEVLHQVDIAGGKHYYQSTVRFEGSSQPLELVPGMVNMNSQELHVIEPDPNHLVLLTHDRQAEDGSFLAMALMIPTQYLLGYGESKESGEGITQSYYGIMDSKAGKALQFRFYSLWEKEDPRWASLEEVKAFLSTEAERWTQSVIYQVH